MRHSLRDLSPARRNTRSSFAPETAGDETTLYKASVEGEPRNRNYTRDTEKNDRPSSSPDQRRRSFAANKDDPFGDEEDAEVKYRTLRWWYVGGFL